MAGLFMLNAIRKEMVMTYYYVHSIRLLEPWQITDTLNTDTVFPSRDVRSGGFSTLDRHFNDRCTRAVVFNLECAYPREYARTSYGV
jgi:hypothetical protein